MPNRRPRRLCRPARPFPRPFFAPTPRPPRLRRLAALPPDRAARLAAALRARGLPAAAQAVEPAGEDGDAGNPAAEVWVHDEDHLPAARAELAAFLADPDAPRYAAAEKQAAAAEKAAAEAAKARRNRTVRGREVFDAPLWRRAPVSVGLIAACCVVAAFGWDPRESLIGLWTRQEPLLTWLWIAPWEVRGRFVVWLELPAVLASGQVWRPFTPMLLHANPLHLLFNMSWLWGLGAALESRFGRARYAAAVLLAAAASNVAEYYVDMALYNPVLGLFAFREDPRFGGMSGVAAALFGFAWGRMKGGDPDLRLDRNGVVLMVGFLLVCLTGTLGGVANAAHFAGLAVGFAGGFGTAKFRPRVRPR